MQSHEYLALPAPRRGQKVKGLKTPAERYAHELTSVLNEMAAEGWDFWRSECLPSEERKGLTGTTIVQNHLLIFRRPSAAMLAEHLGQSEPTLAPPRADEGIADAPRLSLPTSDRQIHGSRLEPQVRASSPDSQDKT